VVYLGFRLSRRPPTERYPYGLERAEDLAGIGIAAVIWASAAFAGLKSVRIEQKRFSGELCQGVREAVAEV